MDEILPNATAIKTLQDGPPTYRFWINDIKHLHHIDHAKIKESICRSTKLSIICAISVSSENKAKNLFRKVHGNDRYL